jgi:hypothetical protein
LLDVLVYIVGGFGFEGGNGHKDTRSGTQTEVRSIEHTFVTSERDRTALYLHIVRSEFNKFAREDLLQTLKGLCQHWKFVVHPANFEL